MRPNCGRGKEENEAAPITGWRQKPRRRRKAEATEAVATEGGAVVEAQQREEARHRRGGGSSRSDNGGARQKEELMAARWREEALMAPLQAVTKKGEGGAACEWDVGQQGWRVQVQDKEIG